MKAGRLLVTSLALVIALLTCSCLTLPRQDGWPDWTGDELPADEPAGPPSVQRLACDIDCLEKHLEKYGSIVPKHADVWGQARLTMYRQEFERVMRPDAYRFDATIQATIATSDQAFLANAFSLQAALGGASLSSAASASQLVSDPKDVIARSAQPRSTIGNYMTSTGKLALEPTVLEDQKKRYLDHLHQLRRINEGDDNTDAPGYALNLVRIPVSVLTGGCTQKGYGAECTITATPHLPDDLLPKTFHDLVINDVVDLLGLELTKVIESMIAEERANEATALWKKLDDAEKELAKKVEASSGSPPGSRAGGLDSGNVAEQRVLDQQKTAEQQRALVNESSFREALRLSKIPSPGLSPRPGKRRPVAPSEVLPVIGVERVLAMALALRPQVIDHRACQNKLLYLDVQAALRAELEAAYDFLSTPQNQHLWGYCTPVLAEAIRSRNREVVVDAILSFFALMRAQSPQSPSTTPAIPARAVTDALAWVILVDAALLTDRFLEDMRATHSAKGCPCAPDGWPPLYLPHPPQDVCQLFNDYVRCRWPLYVFAIDPETEDQNVGDSFALRRELQLAMSLAFVNGQMSASNFTRYVRRIEQDIDTIALNRTIVGFSHGDNTFGWRFYPRVQTPPVNGNLEAAFRDLLLGSRGPGYELRRRRLENGIRECVALVIMPSFVPYVDLDVTGNWFRLADPKCKALDLKQVMRLSRKIKAIQDRAPLACDNARYRPGDTGLMLRRLDQLAQRLPLQSQLVSVPYENTHGGFELLSAGVTNLAPELFGWYGAPGIDPDGDTALFLVGNNFSVHQTRVIVGGRLLDPFCKIVCSNAPPAKGVDCTCDQAKTTAVTAAATAKQTTAVKGTTVTAEHADAEGPVLGEPGAAAPPAPDAAGEAVQQAVWRRPPAGPTPRPPAGAVTVINALPAGLGVKASNLAAVEVMTSAAGAKATAADAKKDAAQAKDTAADAKKDAAAGNTDAAAKKTDAAATQVDAAAKKVESAATQADATASKAAAAAIDITSTTSPASPSYEIPHYQVELLSRQVMRVVIPKGAHSLNGVVDVHVATPYGVSAHLAVPVLCDTKAPPAPAPVYGYSVDANSKVTIRYALLQRVSQGVVSYKPVFLGNGPKDNIRIAWASTTGSILPRVSATFAFTFKGKDLGGVVVEDVKAQSSDTRGGYFEIAEDKLRKFSTDLLLDELVPREPKGFTPDNLPPAGMTTKSIKIRLKDDSGQHVTQSVATANQLTVQLELTAPTAALDDVSLGLQVTEVEEGGQKVRRYRLTGDAVEALKKLRVTLPGITEDGFALRVFLPGFAPDAPVAEAALRHTGNHVYQLAGEPAVTALKNALEAAINAKSSPGDKPLSLKSERITVSYTGPEYKDLDIVATGGITFLPGK